MSILLYILLAWAIFVVCVYAHFIYDITSTHIDIRKCLIQIRDAFTEEE